jgi:hypothetical protein
MEEDGVAIGLVEDRTEAVPTFVPMLSLLQVVAKKIVESIEVDRISLVGLLMFLAEIKEVTRIVPVGQEGKQYPWT